MNTTPTQPPQGVMAPKVGDRVMHVLGTDYDDACIAPGDSGTVTATDDDGVQVKWDNPTSDYCDGTWWIDAASLKPYERTYSEAEYSALLARCEGLEAALREIAGCVSCAEAHWMANDALAATRTTGGE